MQTCFLQRWICIKIIIIQLGTQIVFRLSLYQAFFEYNRRGGPEEPKTFSGLPLNKFKRK